LQPALSLLVGLGRSNGRSDDPSARCRHVAVLLIDNEREEKRAYEASMIWILTEPS
jgi:hypothetical protein